MKKVGLSALDDSRIKYSNLANDLSVKKQLELTNQFQLFKSILLNFLNDYSHELSTNLKLRNEFIRICSMIGIDPLLVYDKTSNLQEFYYELMVRLIEYSNSTQNINGGLLLIDEFIKKYSSLNITLKDVEIVVSRLQILNDNFKLIKVGNLLYLKNFKIELTNNQNLILQLIQQLGTGHLNKAQIKSKFDWNFLQIDEVLDEMVRNGHLWVDSQADNGETSYWDPSFIVNL